MTRDRKRAGGVPRGGGANTREGGPSRVGGVVLRGPWAPDLTNIKVSPEIAHRGLLLHLEGKVRELIMFPGVFHVTGGSVDKRGQVHIYTVDMREQGHPTCGCEWFQQRVQTCKHIVAVAAWYVGKDEVEIRKALAGVGT